MVHQELLVQLALVVVLEHQGQQGPQDHREELEDREQLALAERQALQELKGHLALKELLAQLDQLVRRAAKA
jgi:hypothetical protein